MEDPIKTFVDKFGVLIVVYLPKTLDILQKLKRVDQRQEKDNHNRKSNIIKNRNGKNHAKIKKETSNNLRRKHFEPYQENRFEI